MTLEGKPNELPDLEKKNLPDMEGQQDASQDNFAALDEGGKKKKDKPVGVLNGGFVVRIGKGDDAEWYQMYEFPKGSGEYVAYQYNDKKQVTAAQGKDFAFVRRQEDWFKKKVVAEANAEEIIGLAGNWKKFTDEIMFDAAKAAGIDDPTLVGKFASNKEMQQIMAKATIGNWTESQIVAAQRDSSFWKNVMYPGIENFYGQTSNPEQAWLTYTNNVSDALESLGYKKNPDGTYNQQIKKMLNKGVDDDLFLSMVPTFQQAVSNSQFFDVFAKRVKKETGQNIEFGDWFDVIAGNSSPELQKVAEGAAIAYEAQQAGYGIGEAKLQRLIEERDLSQAQARQLFNDVNTALLALGDEGLANYGLSKGIILSTAAGISPENGKSVAENQQLIAKIAQENDLFDEEKINFYVGYDPVLGTSTRPGLASLRPVGA